MGRSRFRFRGRELSQEYNRNSIQISMSKFVQDMESIAVPKHVKDDIRANAYQHDVLVYVGTESERKKDSMLRVWCVVCVV